MTINPVVEVAIASILYLTPFPTRELRQVSMHGQRKGSQLSAK